MVLSSQAQKRHQLPKPLGRDAYKYVSTPSRPVKQLHHAADEKIDYVAQPPPPGAPTSSVLGRQTVVATDPCLAEINATGNNDPV